ncbi:hypothetical protein [Flavisolibacter tropicus]|uniref:Uncharacterized protein n=1 Tax=Flavisolibacter tropicus TaxID=1492898 RepID=A0A172TRD8_9BACT|nr:hypothetical protein [Flavisolibacter tropicus]ANE49444.1 hypothetical protein SY85_01950 [Flavisolibacter tropicus]
MRSVLLIIGLITVVSVCGQSPVWQQNKTFVDSLISMYRTKSGCSLTGSTLKQARKKKRLDLKLLEFLNGFYYGEFDSKQIEATLQRNFKQTPWRFDQKGVIDSFHVFKGRLRSFGNLEPFITYVVLNNEVIGTHITIKIRSTVDCLQTHDGEIPDLLYLTNLIPGRINFPFEVEGWTGYFDSKVWIKNGLSIELQNRIRRLIGKSSATPLKLTA